jgi:chromate reductase
MSDNPPPIRILGIAGSLRSGSHNRALLRAAIETAPEDMIIVAFDLLAVPVYNGDAEADGDPAGVAALKQAIRSADGVLLVTPEYNPTAPFALIREDCAFGLLGSSACAR